MARGETFATPPGQTERPKRNIELRIDEMILDGVPAAQRFQIANAVQSELTGKLTREGIPQSLVYATGHSTDVVDGGAIPLASGARSESVGSQLAGAIYRGIARGEVPQGKRN